MLNTAWRARSEVGRVRSPAGVVIALPRNSPETIRISRAWVRADRICAGRNAARPSAGHPNAGVLNEADLNATRRPWADPSAATPTSGDPNAMRLPKAPNAEARISEAGRR